MSGSIPSEPVIGSYVHHKASGKAWNVSTINRQCSSPHNPVMYYETMVWEWDAEARKRGALVHQAEGWDAHFAICQSLLDSGTIPGGEA